MLDIVRRSGGGTLDLIELGASAGLNLVWDSYRYVYERGTWGRAESPLELSGEERRAVPAELLGLEPRIRGRLGLEIAPVDVTDERQALLLKSFVWADQAQRLARLDQAIEAIRSHPPQLERADILERIPALLAERRPGALTVVYATAVFPYVERPAEVVAEIENAGRTGALAFLYTGPPAPGEHGYWGLWLRLWPQAEDEVLLAHAGFHGQWLEWLA